MWQAADLIVEFGELGGRPESTGGPSVLGWEGGLPWHKGAGLLVKLRPVVYGDWSICDISRKISSCCIHL